MGETEVALPAHFVTRQEGCPKGGYRPTATTVVILNMDKPFEGEDLFGQVTNNDANRLDCSHGINRPTINRVRYLLFLSITPSRSLAISGLKDMGVVVTIFSLTVVTKREEPINPS